jgi:nicotinamide mononucleotide (NMN) deamidase PncC
MGLGRDDIKGMRSATEPYALLMARTIREKLDASWGLCETGASGPSGNGYGDAAGHVCVGVVGSTEQSRTIETGLSDRKENMYLFAEAALELLNERLG